LLIPALSFALCLGQFVLPAIAEDKAGKTVWDGVYTAAQANRGQTVYEQSCMRCHGEDMTRSGDVLVGTKFMDEWREDSLQGLFTTLRISMPRNAPQSLTDDEYLDVVAYLLQVNSFPAAPTEELMLDALDRIRVVGKEGPNAAPNFSLVTVVGCLTQVSADSWMLKNASEPVRTHNPRESGPAELADIEAQPPGQHDFGLLDSRNFPAQTITGHWMEAKGLLMRAPGNDRLNLTWLRKISDSCKQPQ
jgi:S-disulfanyl-L-cysteine oxidoreductase SoxD